MLSDLIRRIKHYITSSLLVKRLNTNPNIKISKGAHVIAKASINCGKFGLIEIGEDTFINELCSIYAHNSTITIGKGVLMGPATVINTFHHSY